MVFREVAIQSDVRRIGRGFVVVLVFVVGAEAHDGFQRFEGREDVHGGQRGAATAAVAGPRRFGVVESERNTDRRLGDGLGLRFGRRDWRRTVERRRAR